MTLPNPHAEQRESEKLLACPFCGGDASPVFYRAGNHPLWAVHCQNEETCGAEMNDFHSDEQARERWNRRPALIDHLEADGGAKEMRACKCNPEWRASHEGRHALACPADCAHPAPSVATGEGDA